MRKSLLIYVCIAFVLSFTVTGVPFEARIKKDAMPRVTLSPQSGAFNQRANLYSSPAVEESLYVSAVQSGRSEEMLDYIIRFPNTYWGALASSRYILMKLSQGSPLEIIVRHLNEAGISCQIVHLYPGIIRRTISMPRAVLFQNQNLHTVIHQNFQNQLNEDPIIAWYQDLDRLTVIPFDALHLIARHQYIRLNGPFLQFFVDDSSSLNMARTSFNKIVFILKDMSRKLGYDSVPDALVELMDEDILIDGKLTIFVYNSRRFKKRYELHTSGWTYPKNGQVYIDPENRSENQFLETLIHKFTHILLSGNPDDLLHSRNRWFDEGFAQWATHSYMKYQTLLNRPSAYHAKQLDRDIRHVRRQAARIANQTPENYIKLLKLNLEWNEENNFAGTSDSRQLSLSLIAYLAESYGLRKLMDVASRISHKGQNLTERSLKLLLEADFNEIEQGWNQWLQDTDLTDSSEDNTQL